MAVCGKPGEFEIGYSSGVGPIWDFICSACLPLGSQRLGEQIHQWEAEGAENYPSCIQVFLLRKNDRKGPCQYDPDEDPGITDNPDMRGSEEREEIEPRKLDTTIRHYPPTAVNGGQTLCGLMEAQSLTEVIGMVNCEACQSLLNK